ncbi:amino acid ABC transporter permease [uncultured Ruegeria sp.]|uniref:amino acid ABC transporter permease n=1 Tax=uncultured Ruegeria sp. TaxID=259304 RepID=UPI0026134696|nr:amino acid ABC transporter permease [uncultured Ruegeria sp.]
MSGSVTASAPPSTAPREGFFQRLRSAYFGNTLSTIITLTLLLILVSAGPAVVRWLITDATLVGTAEDCRTNGGACWAFIGAKWNLILFGAYPVDELWRPALFMALVVAIAIYGFFTRRTLGRVLISWITAFFIGILLMRGGFLGLTLVDNDRWGGLPITLVVTIGGLAGAFPLGVLLMLGSVSKNTAINVPCKIFVEIVRGIPAITLVFMTFAIIPLLMPQGMMIDKLTRAAFGLTLLTSAYFAEALRGALQALPKGQTEASEALGFGYWKRQRLIILPQVIANSMQPIVNIAIAFVKATSLLIIIGLFDLLGAARSSLFDGNWQGFYRELYLFIGLIYLVICLFLDAYVGRIERERSARIQR